MAGADALRAAIIGAAGGALLAFVAPQKGISYLMHQVLMLPGPGAGLGVMVGPWAAFCCLAAAVFVRRRYAALVAGLGFALVFNLPAAVFPPEGTNPGMFASVRFALGLVLMGGVAELVMARFRRLGRGPRLALAAVAADLAFLVYTWVVVFPLTKGWVTMKNALIIIAVSVPAAVVAGAGFTLAALAVAGEPPIVEAGEPEAEEEDAGEGAD